MLSVKSLGLPYCPRLHTGILYEDMVGLNNGENLDIRTGKLPSIPCLGKSRHAPFVEPYSAELHTFTNFRK